MSDALNLDAFGPGDVPAFLRLAAAEGWIAEAWEFDFLLGAFPAGCRVVRDADGRAAGFVTALRHGCSGWIGNLIVASAYRGRGIGEALFLQALEALITAGAETVWLTASAMGKGLYERHGFRTIDVIVRWTTCGTGRGTAGPTVSWEGALAGIDRRGWGDDREALLAATAERGLLRTDGEGFLVSQPCGESVQFGPFGAPDAVTAGRLLNEALNGVAAGRKVCLDAPAANRPATGLYERQGMAVAGTNELMYFGKCPEYRPEYVYGLATMGSSG